MITAIHPASSRSMRDVVASGEFDIGLVAGEIDVSGVAHQPFVASVLEDRARQQLDAILAAAGSARSWRNVEVQADPSS